MNQETSETYPQSWYPLLVSHTLKKNKIRAIKAFNQDLLVFRDSNGQVGIVNRYCCHMGVDLAQATMVNNCIQCPLHGWQFDHTGACRLIPSIKSADKNLLGNHSLTSFPCQEMYGIIFVFWGDAPVFEMPLPPNMNNIKAGNCFHYHLSTEYHIPCLNTFDLQHFQHIHHRHIIGTPNINQLNLYHMGIKMETDVIIVNLFDKIMKWLFQGTATISIDCWGASLLLMNNNKTNFGAVIGTLPIEKYQSLMFIVPVKTKSKKENFFTPVKDKLSFMIATKMIKAFFAPDKIPMTGMRPINGCLLDGLDDAAKNYWHYYNALPRYSNTGPSQSSDKVQLK